jgi:hypothetical protein
MKSVSPKKIGAGIPPHPRHPRSNHMLHKQHKSFSSAQSASQSLLQKKTIS